MTHERRVVHHVLRVQDDRQIMPAGRVVAAEVRKDYPDDALGLQLHLWVETEVLLPAEQPNPGECTRAWPGGLTDVIVVGTNRTVPEQAEHLVSVADSSTRNPLAWHIYRVAADRWADEIEKRALVAIAAASEAGRHRASMEQP